MARSRRSDGQTRVAVSEREARLPVACPKEEHDPVREGQQGYQRRTLPEHGQSQRGWSTGIYSQPHASRCRTSRCRTPRAGGAF
jgi:hypothetical protein